MADIDVLLWLKERANNCIRIAQTKSGTDATGWIEDAQYFTAAIKLIQQQARTIKILREPGSHSDIY